MSTLPTNINFKIEDSLSKIAQEYLGDSSLWRELSDFNNIDIFKAIKVGQAITIPTKDEAERRFKNIAANEILKVDNDIKEIINSRQVKSITKLLGVDQTQLLKDLDLSSLAKGLQSPTKAEILTKALKGKSSQTETPIWNLIDWVLTFTLVINLVPFLQNYVQI